MPNALNLLVAINPQDDWGLVFATVVTGLVVVFLILALLIFLLWLLGVIFADKKKKNTEPAVKTEPALLNTVPKPIITKKEDNHEIVAVIAAAIAAIGAEEGKTLRITGIRKTEKKNQTARSSWSRAGISENTSPFIR